MLVNGIDAKDIEAINKRAINLVAEDYQKALAAEDPRPEDLFTHDFAPTPVIEEKGVREPAGKENGNGRLRTFRYEGNFSETSRGNVIRTRCWR